MAVSDKFVSTKFWLFYEKKGIGIKYTTLYAQEKRLGWARIVYNYYHERFNIDW